MKISFKKKIAAAAAAATIVGGVGIAYGYWSTTGSGTGSASTAAGVEDTLDFTTSTITDMYPGDSEQTFTVGAVAGPDLVTARAAQASMTSANAALHVTANRPRRNVRASERAR